MAKYNLSRYNSAKYNRSVSAGIVYDELEAGALFTAFIGLGQTTKDAINAQCRFTAEAKMAAGSLNQTTWTAVFTPAITGVSITWGKGTLVEELASDCALSPLVKDSTEWAEDFAGDIYLGPKVLDPGLSMDAEIGCDTYLGNLVKDPDGLNEYALFNAVVEAESYEEIIMNLSDLVIPAGGVLTIDSDNFRVLLDGVNAIKYHSGDWIDQLNRTSESITIQSSGTGLTASIYYQELWL